MTTWDEEWGDDLTTFHEAAIEFIRDNFVDPQSFFDGEPTLADCRKLLVATMRRALEILDPPQS